ncbi:sigma-70 family RNA polymerase sigma factor [Mesobacillus harenae]|uniref:sigma-70 family RNA polymerase sigma factor n=1 Tax=Mesobacillus harenae TaxID=2213203 RepID=UPI001F54F165|nr:sigma-70 family RNA polymerase sigma factor [Mesobacillus harenae]
MIPVKIDSGSITIKTDNQMDSIVEWFDQHKQSFYILGWSYLRNQQQMEELFYRSIIKVHKELHRFKRETSFDLWVTSIFIHTCRELSADKRLQASEDSEQRQDLFKALDLLNQHEREAVVLRYIKGISQEETAQLLQVSVEKIKDYLFSGILELRKGMGYGSAFNGCKEYHKNYIDYLERTLDRPEKIDFEIHIYHCQDCQEDLGTFQDVMLTMLNLTEKINEFQVPGGFLGNVRGRLAEEEHQRQLKNKKRQRKRLVFAAVLALVMGIGFFTGAFTNIYYAWTEEDQELRAFLQQDLGERLNLEAESNGVKIKIKSVIADEVQTLVFYEIEDTDEDNQYMMNYQDGVFIENEHEIMNHASYPRYYPPDLDSDLNKEKKNVYLGKMSLLPLQKENGALKLKINKIQKWLPYPSDPDGFRAYHENMQFETGEWNFEIPVEKQPSIEYALDKEIEVEGIPVRFEKLTIAPTATILEFGINNEQPGKRIDVINFDNLEVNDKKLKPDMYGSSYINSHQEMNWDTLQTHFDPLFGENPIEINVQLASAHLTFDDPKTIELDASEEYPQTFEYAGSTISIDKVEVGNPTKVVISNHEIENRAYESFHFNIEGEDGYENISMQMDSEGVLVDRSGKEYDMNEIPVLYEELEQPRHFITVQRIGLQGNNVIPKRLEIYGYNSMKYLDEVVKIAVD